MVAQAPHGTVLIVDDSASVRALVTTPLRRVGYRVVAAADGEQGFAGRRVEVDGSEVELTPLEYRLLTAFVRNAGHVLSRDHLLREVWHDTSGGPNDHVKTYVGYLRRKLGCGAEGAAAPIEIVRGFGYRWRLAA